MTGAGNTRENNNPDTKGVENKEDEEEGTCVGVGEGGRSEGRRHPQLDGEQMSSPTQTLHLSPPSFPLPLPLYHCTHAPHTRLLHALVILPVLASSFYVCNKNFLHTRVTHFRHDCLCSACEVLLCVRSPPEHIWGVDSTCHSHLDDSDKETIIINHHGVPAASLYPDSAYF